MQIAGDYMQMSDSNKQTIQLYANFTAPICTSARVYANVRNIYANFRVDLIVNHKYKQISELRMQMTQQTLGLPRIEVTQLFSMQMSRLRMQI